LILLWGNFHDGFKLPVEIRQVVEARFKTGAANRVVAVTQQPAGIRNPYLVEELCKMFQCTAFEVTAKRSFRHVGNSRNFF
jgi:hypothetical protein